MTKHRWLIVAGALALAGCGGPITEVCVDAVPSGGAHHNADEIGLVECSDRTAVPLTAPSDAK
jgi:hypothetical protein